MRFVRSGVIVAASCAAALIAASNVWESKDFNNWTDKDAQAVLADSPWAKTMPMPAGGRPGVMVLEPGSNSAPPPSASLGNPSNTPNGPNMTGSSYPGSGGPADSTTGNHTIGTAQTPSGMANPSGAPAPPETVRVIWASAAPVRLAVLKLRSNGNPITAEEITNATKPRENYVVAVSGLPEPDRDYDPNQVANRAFLTIKGKAPVAATDCNYRKIGNSDVYFFRFHKTSLPIGAADQQVEFKMKMGSIEIKQKFALKEMQFQGQLAL